MYFYLYSEPSDPEVTGGQLNFYTMIPMFLRMFLDGFSTEVVLKSILFAFDV